MATDRLRAKLRDNPSLSTHTANYCSIGTPLPSLTSSKKDANELKPIWQQEARDSQGRRRFHGAFTGGFSAGYYNTVGSQEGWTPGSFRSSRSNRRDGKEAVGGRVEDFMDEEDLADWKAAQRVSTGSGSGSADRFAESTGKSDPLASLLFGDARVNQNKDTLGFQLLRKMGWKQGQGLGPRIDARKKARLLSLISNSSDDASTIATSSNFTLEDLKHLYAPPPTPILTVATAQNGSKKGLGAEDRPTLHQVLAKGYISKADSAQGIREGDEDGIWPDGRPMLVGFRLATEPPPPQPSFPTEEVLKGWQPDPSRVLSTLKTPALDAKLSKENTPATRGQLLGEAKLPGPPPNIAAFLSAKSRERLASSSTSNAILPTSSPVSFSPQNITAPRLDVATASQALQAPSPYTTDPAKQARYETYLKRQLTPASQPTLKLPVPPELTLQQYQHELEGFAKAAAMFRPMSAAIASRFTKASAAVMEHETRATSAVPGLRHPNPATASASKNDLQEDGEGSMEPVKELSTAQRAAQMGNFGHLTRKVEPWAPERLLCKRFGIPEPAISRKRKGEAVSTSTQQERPALDDDADPFYGSSRSSKSKKAIRVDQHWERNKEQLKALAAGPTPLSLDAASSSRHPAVSSEDDVVEETAVGMGDDERQGQDTLTYVKPSMDVYKAIFASDEEASDSEDAAGKGRSAKPKMQDPSSGTGVVFQARSKRKDAKDDEAEKPAGKPASAKRKKEKASKKALLTFDLDDDGDVGQERRKEKVPKKSLLVFGDADGAPVEGSAMSDEPMKSQTKGRMRASDLF
ncbi:uncharacterized protein UTRI_01333_B [Ustilago trichophora]|uniref:G-patch domain-containing protein n=1 Tax=Ustilago trichophora TaxID=86804 RepID=A0A5C3DW40_9BASI|nr:uncharacterized protein UTRI_01333_B [Ustilago trichophora]